MRYAPPVASDLSADGLDLTVMGSICSGSQNPNSSLSTMTGKTSAGVSGKKNRGIILPRTLTISEHGLTRWRVLKRSEGSLCLPLLSWQLTSYGM